MYSPAMMVLPGARVIGQHESQGLFGQHRFVNGSDLVGQWIDVGRMHGHHGIEEKREIDAFGFAGELEGRTVSVE